MTQSASAAQDIAIIGMACLFPQSPTLDAYWRTILGRIDATSEGSLDWLGHEDILDVEMADAFRLYTRRGGFLGDLARFDPRQFGIMPVSLAGSEPDQFLALQCATDALADAGYSEGNYDPERTGIILGHGIHPNRANVGGVQQTIILDQTIALLRDLLPDVDVQRMTSLRSLLKRKLPTMSSDTAPGLVPNMMTGRIANRLNLMGPNYILDAACASSLLAIGHGLDELRSGRCDLMLAGGVNTSTSNMVFMLFCEIGALSRREKVRPFDRNADGTMLGEGQGIVVLKRLEDARRDGNRIYALIKGVGTASDGRATGLMAPRLEGEMLAMQRAYRETGVDPASVELVEAHGTGIPLGDRTEIEALHTIFGERTLRFPDVALGSVKSNIGHCIPAAGAASLIKTALALHYKVLPPSLCDEANPDLSLTETRFHVNTEAAPWIHGGNAPRRAGINAFGFGGINCHMILEEAPDAGEGAVPGAAFAFRRGGASPVPTAPVNIFVLSAESRDDLAASIEGLRTRLTDEPRLRLEAIAAQLAADASPGPERLAIVATSAQDLEAKLNQAAKRLRDGRVHRFHTRSGIYFRDRPQEGKVAFLFPGENSQHPGMLKDLAVFSPAVREWLDYLDALFLGDRELPHRILLFPPSNGLADEDRQAIDRRLLDVDAGSEAVFFADQALASLLAGLGVKPDAIVGHSTGENAALIASHLFGFTREQAGAYILRMNEIYRRLEAEAAIPTGVLLTVGGLDRPALVAILDACEGVSITMDNCPNQAILFGNEELIDRLTPQLSAAGAICSRLPLAWAYHTPGIAPMAEAFEELFGTILRTETPVAPLYSCTTAGPFPDDLEAIRELMVAQYTSPVRFTETVERLYADGVRVFIEVGPSGFLCGFVRDILQKRSHLAIPTDVRRRNGLEHVHHVLAQLFVAGVPVDLSARYASVEPTQNDHSGAPVLASHLPFVRLSGEEATEARALLGFNGQQQQSAPESASQQRRDDSRTPAGGGGVTSSAESRVADRGAVVGHHLSLMDGFLRTQSATTMQMVQRRASDAAGPVLRRWTDFFSPPLRTEIVVAGAQGAESGAVPELDALAARVLSVQERLAWTGSISNQHPRRRCEWLLARLAGKHAVRLWLGAEAAVAPALADITIGNGPSGEPIVTFEKELAAQGSQPAISISHVDGFAVAAASETRARLGVDVEGPDRVRNGSDLLRRVATSSEQSLVTRLNPGRDSESAAFVWCVKEAAAKALGISALASVHEMVVTHLSADGRHAKLKFRDTEVVVEINRFSAYYCALAQAAAGDRPGSVDRSTRTEAEGTRS